MKKVARMKRKICFVAFVLLTVLVTSCEKIVDPGSSADKPKTVSLLKDSVRFTVSLQNTTFAQTDSLLGTFLVENLRDTTVTFSFGNVQQFGFSVSDDAGKLRIFEPEGVFPSLSSLTLLKAQSKTFLIKKTFLDRNNILLEKGTYTFSAYLTEGNSPALYLTITIQ